MLHCNNQLFFSVCSSQLKETYDASKKASNQQLFVRMLGSFIKLSLLSRRISKVQLRKIPCAWILVQSRQNRAKTAVLAHADHIQHVIACEQPIGIKQKRSSKLLYSLFKEYEMKNTPFNIELKQA